MAKVISLQQGRLLFSTGSGSFFLKQLCWGGNQASAEEKEQPFAPDKGSYSPSPGRELFCFGMDTR